MFYSQLLLSKTGALGVVWMAAHCHKRLRKCDIQQTDISSSVDKILDDEVREVTHRILAFLLLGIVRIHSKKAEYLYNDCHDMLNRLSGIKTRKSKQAEIGVSLTYYHSISLPKRFELDTFDLELVEHQDVVGGKVRSRGKDKRADRRRKDASTSGLLRKETAQISGSYTPPKDVFGHTHMGQNLLVGPSSNNKISLAGVEVLRGTRFSLDHIDLDEAGDEDMHKKQTDEDLNTIFQAPSNDYESDSDVGPSNNRTHTLPSLDILCGPWFALEDRLEPMVLDEAEKDQLNARPSNNKEPIQDVELDLINRQSSKGGDYEAEKVQDLDKPVDNEEPIQDVELDLINPQSSKEGDYEAEKVQGLEKPADNHQSSKGGDYEAEKGQGLERPDDNEELDLINHQSSKGGDYEAEKGQGLEKHVQQHLSSEFNFEEGEHQDCTASVDKAKPGDKMPEVITLEIKRRRPEKFRVPVVTPDSKIPGAGNSEVAFVQTPGRKERAKIQKKQKTLLDSSTLVVPNKVIKDWIDDATDLKRKRREVPHTLLGAWRAKKRAHFPQSFFEPSIPGIAVEFQFNNSCVPAPKTVELYREEECANSPVKYGAQEQIPDARSPIREKTPRQTLDVQLPVIEESPIQTPIAPGTPPAAHFDQLRPHEFGAVADSDILEPANSFESTGKGPSSSEFDVLFEEETSSFEGESLKKGDAFSTRTRMAGSFLSRKFLDKKNREEEEVLSLSRLLVGKTKKESARFFYETLVLKTQDCIDVHQEAAYHDIELREKPKLRQLLSS